VSEGAKDTLRYAEGYAERGLAVIPIPEGRKGPTLPSWQHLRIRPEEVGRYFDGRPSNVGLLLGEPSRWVVDVDCDVPEAVSSAPLFLPETVRSGRRSSPSSHHWYLSQGTRTEKFKDADGATLLELRSTGCQTLVAPSVHPSGDRYAWEPGTRRFAEVPAEELLRRCRLVATAALVARRLPPVGGRHDFALALGGFLLRGDRLDEDETLRVMEAAWAAAGGATGDAERDLAGIVRDTARNISEGLEVVGGRRLDELAPGLPWVLTRWWKWGSPREQPGPHRRSRLAPRVPRDGRNTTNPASAPAGHGPRRLPEAVAFPVEAMPEKCQRFVREGCEAIGCPPELLGMPVLAVVSGAIGASRVVEIKPSWREDASLFLAVVAPPGAKKTPASKAATEPVRKRQAELRREHREKMAVYNREMREWEVDKKLAYKDNAAAPPQPEKPTMGRVIADDITVEALVGILEDNPRGLLVDKDELTGWVRAMDQYKSGKGADRQHWLSIWSGKQVVVDRKSRAGEPVILTRPWVSLFGGIQPAMLKELEGAQGDGLLDRFLFAFPAPRRTLFSEAEISPEAEREYNELYRSLLELRMVEDEWGEPNPGIVPMTPGARARFRRSVDAMSAETFEPGFPARLQGMWSKSEGYLARIALIFGLCRAATTGEPERVEEEDVEAAAKLVAYFEAHARRVYAELGSETSEDLLAGEIKNFLKEHEGEWEGSATELYDELEAREAEGLPENPEWLSRTVLAIGQRVESLEVTKRKSGSKRFLKLALRNAVPTAPADPGEDGKWDGRDSRDGKSAASEAKTTADLESTDERHLRVADPLEDHRVTSPEAAAVGSAARATSKAAERCIHDYPGGEGCYLCDPRHPARRKDKA
jgi:hypothetical protein